MIYRVTARGLTVSGIASLCRDWARRLLRLLLGRPSSTRCTMHRWALHLRGRHGLKDASRRLFSTNSRICQETPIMNRYSRTVTQPKTQGASQAMLYATEGVSSDEDFNKAMVGVASVWQVIFIRSVAFTAARQLPLGTRGTREPARRS